MYKNKSKSGSNNICGQRIKNIRQSLQHKTSQRTFAEMLQMEGLDVDKNTIQRIEAGTRFVTDIELKIICKVLNVPYKDLLGD